MTDFGKKTVYQVYRNPFMIPTVMAWEIYAESLKSWII